MSEAAAEGAAAHALKRARSRGTAVGEGVLDGLEAQGLKGIVRQEYGLSQSTPAALAARAVWLR